MSPTLPGTRNGESGVSSVGWETMVTGFPKPGVARSSRAGGAGLPGPAIEISFVYEVFSLGRRPRERAVRVRFVIAAPEASIPSRVFAFRVFADRPDFPES